MKLQKWPLLILIVIALFCQCKPAQLLDIQYTDQNNNQYILKDNTLRYIPITEIESSSGTYSGGDPATVRVSTADAIRISELADGLIVLSKGKQVKREKLTAVLRVTKYKESKSVILRKSEKRNELEMLLLNLITENKKAGLN